MHKFTLRYASHTIPILSLMLFIPSLYYPFLNLKNFLFTSLPFLCMHACMNLVYLLLLFTNIKTYN